MIRDGYIRRGGRLRGVGMPDPNYPGLDANGNTPGDIACLKDPNCDMTKHLQELITQDQNATGAGWLPEMTPAPASITDSLKNLIPSTAIPNWVYAALVASALTFLWSARR